MLSGTWLVSYNVPVFPSNLKSAKVDKVRARVLVVMQQCVLCGHTSAQLAYIWQRPLAASSYRKQAKVLRGEGCVFGLCSTKCSANVFECLASWSLTLSSLLLCCALWSANRWWQRTASSASRIWHHRMAFRWTILTYLLNCRFRTEPGFRVPAVFGLVNIPHISENYVVRI